jgi:cysteine synthase A
MHAAIGNTPLVQLRSMTTPSGAPILVKLESQNPTGSLKDRMAYGVISRAEADGRLEPGYRVIEYTGGSTGTSLALVCAVKRYPLTIVTSDAFSPEKRDHMRALGAELTIVPSEGGRTTKALIERMIETARQLSQAPRTFWVNQLHNHDAIAGYHALGEEIWRQANGEIAAFVHSVGTAASLRGVASVLKAKHPETRVVAVEPDESAVLSGGRPGAHHIEGVGIGYTPPLWDWSVVDAVVPVSTARAQEVARQLAREEGIFAGTSTGANVAAALDYASRSGHRRGAIVTLAADSGLKYLHTELYGHASASRS